jgi:predicted alpha/beta-hydrolase family hydrolase
MYSIKALEIKGYRDEPVPHTFYEQEGPSSQVALLLPGMGYTSHMPLLYYPARIMLSLGADVLGLEYEYNRREEFMTLPGEERKSWLLADVTNACETLLKVRAYQEITLIGKSLGTRAMGHLLTTSDPLREANAIWLTPVFRSEGLCRQIKEWGKRSLIVIGTADPHYNQALLDEIQDATRSEMLVIEGADHSLEIGGDVLRSLDTMEKVIRAIQAFVTH